MAGASTNLSSRPYPSQYVSSWKTQNGVLVTIRPIRPEDEPLMVKFHATLSDRTVYMRYFTSISLSRRTAHERLIRICNCDYEREMVLVAEGEKLETPEREILAVGRLNKLRKTDDSRGSHEAEVAVLVSDQYQRQRLGRELLRRLIEIAPKEKITRIVAEMLRDNVAMQNLFKSLGFRFESLGDPASVQATLDL